MKKIMGNGYFENPTLSFLVTKATTTTGICMYVSKRARLHFLTEQEGFV